MGAESQVHEASSPTLPYPPLHLANRVGALEGGHPYAQYDWIGRRGSDDLRANLPRGWTWRGRRILDLGCGAGRTLRHFMNEAAVSEFHGCDIDAESIAWLQEHLSPPFHCVVNAESPPLPFPSDSFDLIYAISVFTHLTDRWSDWMLEVQRLLQPGGLALLTFMGRSMVQSIAGEPLADDDIGMTVLRTGASWDEGGPMVLHSEWWIREHWGRAFDVLSIVPDGFAWEPGFGQGIAVLRKSTLDVQIADLERPAVDEAREAAALRTNLRLVHEESRRARAELTSCLRQRALLEHTLNELSVRLREVETNAARLRHLQNSLSWRLTGPLRSLRRAAKTWGWT